MGEMSPWHWAIVILVLVLLFGAKKLPEAARGLGRSARILRAELHGSGREDTEVPPNPAATREADERTPTATPEEPAVTRSQTPSRPD